MTIHQLLEQVSDILTPETHSLYDYMLHTFDDNGGFLRTRYCYWDKPLRDYKISNLTRVLICFREPFQEGELYEDTIFGKETLVKMQLFYSSTFDKSDIIWSCEMGYGHALVIDLENKQIEKVE